MAPIAGRLPNVRTGKLRALATGGQTAVDAAGRATVAESGYPAYNAVGWSGIYVPNGTPQPIIDKLNCRDRRGGGQARNQEAVRGAGVEGATARSGGRKMLKRISCGSGSWRAASASTRTEAICPMVMADYRAIVDIGSGSFAGTRWCPPAILPARRHESHRIATTLLRAIAAAPPGRELLLPVNEDAWFPFSEQRERVAAQEAASLDRAAGDRA